MKQGFQSELLVETVDAKNWRIQRRFGWRGSKGDTFWVEEGDRTDFASVPWWSQFLIPRTGTWTKAAVLHDKMCALLNSYYKLYKQYLELEKAWLEGWHPDRSGIKPIKPLKPPFNSVDTDAVFRKNARELGTDPIRSELLWFGVRCGALKNAARRTGWMSTFPRFLGDLVAIVGVLALVGYLVFGVL